MSKHDTLEAAQRETMARYGNLARHHAGMLVMLFDSAAAAGLAIPPKAAEALGTLGALAEAWQANGRGESAPTDVKRALGLLDGLQSTPRQRPPSSPPKS